MEEKEGVGRLAYVSTGQAFLLKHNLDDILTSISKIEDRIGSISFILWSSSPLKYIIGSKTIVCSFCWEKFVIGELVQSLGCFESKYIERLLSSSSIYLIFNIFNIFVAIVGLLGI